MQSRSRVVLKNERGFGLSFSWNEMSVGMCKFSRFISSRVQVSMTPSHLNNVLSKSELCTMEYANLRGGARFKRPLNLKSLRVWKYTTLLTFIRVQIKQSVQCKAKTVSRQFGFVTPFIWPGRTIGMLEFYITMPICFIFFTFFFKAYWIKRCLDLRHCSKCTKKLYSSLICTIIAVCYLKCILLFLYGTFKHNPVEMFIILKCFWRDIIICTANETSIPHICTLQCIFNCCSCLTYCHCFQTVVGALL